MFFGMSCLYLVAGFLSGERSAYEYNRMQRARAPTVKSPICTPSLALMPGLAGPARLPGLSGGQKPSEVTLLNPLLPNRHAILHQFTHSLCTSRVHIITVLHVWFCLFQLQVCLEREISNPKGLQ